MLLAFQTQIGAITGWLANRMVTPALSADLNANFPPGGEAFQSLARLCHEGMRDGWLGQRGDEKLRWGRVIKPTPDTKGFSVDVVRMTEIVGPRHSHPNGEIDMIISVDADARFDAHDKGWLVYAAESAHSPTVSGGTTIILYLLPQGAIEFGAA